MNNISKKAGYLRVSVLKQYREGYIKKSIFAKAIVLRGEIPVVLSVISCTSILKMTTRFKRVEIRTELKCMELSSVLKCMVQNKLICSYITISQSRECVIYFKYTQIKKEVKRKMELHTIESTTIPIFHRVDGMQAFALNSIIRMKRCNKCGKFLFVNVKGTGFICWACLQN